MMERAPSAPSELRYMRKNSSDHPTRKAIGGWMAAAAGLFLFAALPVISSAQPSFAEFPVPTPSAAPQGITAGPDGAVWFTENASDKIGRIDVNGVFTEYAAAAGSGIYQIAAGHDGNLYFTAENGSFIGQIVPSTSKVNQIPITNIGSNLAATTGIAVDSAGNIWFAMSGTMVNAIGELTVTSTANTFATPIPLLTANSEPNSMTFGPDGNLWFTEECPAVTACTGTIGKIGMVNVTTRVLTETPVGAGTGPFGIASDGTKLWFTERDKDAVASITTSSVVSAPTALSSGAAPLGITLGVDGALWVAESGTGKIARITPAGTLTAESAIPTPSSGPYGITVGPDHALWFTEDTANAIGRISDISFESFQLLPIGGQLTQLSIGADGSVWGRNQFEQTYNYNPSTTPASWTNIAGTLKTIVAGNAKAVWGLNYANQVYRLNAAGNGWSNVPGELNQIAVGADGDVWGLNYKNNIYHYNGSGWTEVGGSSGQLSLIAVGSANTVYGVNDNGGVFWYNPGDGGFEWLTGTLGFGQTAGSLAVGVDGDVWAVKSNVAYHWDVLHGTMDATTGASISQVVVGSGAAVFGLDPSGGVWQWDAVSQSWVQPSGSPTLSNIAVGANGIMWGANSAGDIYQLLGAPTRGYQTFSVIANAALDQISVGADGAVWGVGSGSVEFFNSGTQTFQAVPNSPPMSQVSVGAGNDVWGVYCATPTSDNCTVYEYLAGSSPAWKTIGGELNKVYVGANGNVWGYNAFDETYAYDFATSSWVQVPGTLTELSVGADGAIWGINASEQVYRLNGIGTSGTASWGNIPGSLLHISVGNTNTVWGVNASDHIYSYDNSTSTWLNPSGTLVEISASSDGAVWGVNQNGNLYQWNSGTGMFGAVGNLTLSDVYAGNDTNVWAINTSTGAVYSWF